jgi:hypothetical protein
MRRRDFLHWLMAGTAGAITPVRAATTTPEEFRRAEREFRRRALEHFPFELVETTGSRALSTWKKLRSKGRGVPVVLGCDDDEHRIDNLLIPFAPDKESGLSAPRPMDEILKAAANIRFPADLVAFRKAESEESTRALRDLSGSKPDAPLPSVVVTDGRTSRTLDREETIAAFESSEQEPPIGNWPTERHRSMGLSVARDVLSEKRCGTVRIALVPTDDWTTVPAHLRWGGWNGCPAAEYHVAALREWRDRYGVELVGMSSDTINLHVKKRPVTREEALALAREQYVYCPDIIDQGVGTYSALAAALMAEDWWYFWWD